MDGLNPARPQRPPVTPVHQLVDWLGPEVVETRGDLGATVTGLCLSSARVRTGDLYAALPGSRAHGADYAADALAAGAAAVLTDPDGLARLRGVDVEPGEAAPVVVVQQPRRVLGRLAARVYGDPATRLRVIGVTGTQGKTTTTRLLEQGLEAAGTPAAVVGTVGTRIRGRDVASLLTTPEAPDLHGLFAVMAEQGVDTCAMEVSSHALVLGRVDGVVFDVATFLNLGRDHLDFHADLDEYFDAKAELFTARRARKALVNIDDEHGRRLLEQLEIPAQTCSAEGRAADWRAEDVVPRPDGSSFTVVDPAGGRAEAFVPVPGAFNVSNALAAIASAALVGHDPAAVADGVARGGGVPGRLEPVVAGQDFTVVVDYAHKPDAVEAVLRTLRPVTSGRLLIVLGAGGDRDPGKRAVMGEIAGRLADVVVVTDDNPRSEDPESIRAAILAGAAGGHAEVLEVGGRRDAIRTALAAARAGDVVVLAGKGHETGQEVDGEVHPFDDRVVAAEELAALREGAR